MMARARGGRASSPVEQLSFPGIGQEGRPRCQCVVNLYPVRERVLAGQARLEIRIRTVIAPTDVPCLPGELIIDWFLVNPDGTVAAQGLGRGRLRAHPSQFESLQIAAPNAPLQSGQVISVYAYLRAGDCLSTREAHIRVV